MFPESLISKEVLAELPAGYSIRPLRAEDFDKGYVALLQQLTVVGDITKEQFAERYAYLEKHNDTYYSLVIEDQNAGRVVGAGTLMVERKFIRNCGKVGHIEDIVVDGDQRGKKFGLRVIHALTHIAKETGCYKVILNCSKDNVGFYERTGFSLKEVEMALYIQE
ncbi:Glucosamine-phosphate N-acetyltransferase-like protein [Blastocladiella emersonii ATCC 22665]|nr:Glucosamine-phosphate N-acetyltransferase-like protein [Blastocladiella emersonii ATCC 22665]